MVYSPSRVAEYPDDMSAVEQNKTLALEFIRLAADNAIDAALNLLHPEATWWVAGDPGRLRVAGLKSRPQIERLLHGLKKALPDGMRMTVTGVTAENDRVAIELDGTGRWHNGKTYHNQYHFLFVIRDARIINVREYMDTLHLQDVNQA
jgi:ketosteroid isomerase-like protein